MNYNYHTLISASDDGLKIVLGGILIFFAIATIGAFLVYCLIRFILFLVGVRRSINHKLSQKQRSELEIILGFDPYKKLSIEEKDIYKNQTNKNDSSYAKKIKECIRDVGVSEKYIAYYSDLKTRSEQRLVTLEYSLAELKEILDTTNAVNDKISKEIKHGTEESSKTRNDNRKIKDLHREEVASSATVIEVSDKIERKKGEIELVKEAIEYLSSSIANEKSKYEIRCSQIEQAHGEGGAEIEQVRAYNKASEILSKNPDLKKMLIDINVRYLEYGKLCSQIEEVESKKREIKARVAEFYTELGKVSNIGTEEISRQINKLNKEVIALEDDKADLSVQRDQKNREVEEINKSLLEFLKAQNNYNKNDMILAEDKVVGDLKYEAVVKRLEERKVGAVAKIDELEKKYQAIAVKMSKKFGKRNKSKTIHEAELKNIVAELNEARIELKTVQDDMDYSLPNISPLSIMKSGNGYISQKWTGAESQLSARDYRLALTQIKNDYVKTVELGYEDSEIKRREILEKLNALEKIVSVEAVEEISQPMAVSLSATPEDRREKLRSVIIEMRNALRLVRSKDDAVALRKKVYEFGKTLTENDLSDPILSELIVRTMNDAKMLGEQAQYVNGKLND